MSLRNSNTRWWPSPGLEPVVGEYRRGSEHHDEACRRLQAGVSVPLDRQSKNRRQFATAIDGGDILGPR